MVFEPNTTEFEVVFGSNTTEKFEISLLHSSESESETDEEVATIHEKNEFCGRFGYLGKKNLAENLA